jgi:hypothetical protein
MATKKTPMSKEYEGHGEDSKVVFGVSKGEYIQVGTVAPLTTDNGTSVNTKTPREDHGAGEKI